MNKGIFYMLTATEIMHIKDVITALMDEAGHHSEEGHQALDLLDKLKPVDTEEALVALEVGGAGA